MISLLVATVAVAQTGPGSTGINSSLLKMFGDVQAFSAKGEMRMSDNDGTEISTVPVTMALLDGKLRTEMTTSEMKGPGIPANAAGMLKSTGMDRVQILVGAGKDTLMIYPELAAYAIVADDGAAADAKAEKSDVGKETLDGHPCVKRKVTFTDAKGKTQDAFLWAATDLKDFPLQIEMQHKRNTIRIHFAAPSLQKPEARLFEVPASYTKYDSVQGLMQAAMMKMFGGAK